MKIDWASWDTGRRIVFVASCVALISFFLPWLDYTPRGTRMHTGFSQGWPLVGLTGFVVPLLGILRGTAFRKVVGYAGAVLALAVGIVFITVFAVEGNAVRTYNVSGYGAYLFVLCAAALGVGAHLAE